MLCAHIKSAMVVLSKYFCVCIYVSICGIYVNIFVFVYM